jgi:hypothetical protein
MQALQTATGEQDPSDIESDAVADAADTQADRKRRKVTADENEDEEEGDDDDDDEDDDEEEEARERIAYVLTECARRVRSALATPSTMLLQHTPAIAHHFYTGGCTLKPEMSSRIGVFPDGGEFEYELAFVLQSELDKLSTAHPWAAWRTGEPPEFDRNALCQPNDRLGDTEMKRISDALDLCSKCVRDALPRHPDTLMSELPGQPPQDDSADVLAQAKEEYVYWVVHPSADAIGYELAFVRKHELCELSCTDVWAAWRMNDCSGIDYAALERILSAFSAAAEKTSDGSNKIDT